MICFIPSKDSAIRLCKHWHPFLTLKKTAGRIDIKAGIKGFAKHYKKTVK